MWSRSQFFEVPFDSPNSLGLIEERPKTEEHPWTEEDGLLPPIVRQNSFRFQITEMQRQIRLNQRQLKYNQTHNH